MEYPGEEDDLQGEEGEDAALLGEESPVISNHQVSQRPGPPLLKSSDPSSSWISVSGSSTRGCTGCPGRR